MPAGNPAAGSASTGGISGLVTGGGHPLRGICALAYRVGGGSGRSAETSPAGRYRITGLLPGRYQVQFSTEFSCGNSGNWLSQWYPGITTPFPAPKAAAIRVRAGKTAGGVDARLRPGGEISGTVRARAGRPLSRICVDVDGRVPGGYLLTELRSGRRGRYALHSLFPGRYTVQFSIRCGNKVNYAPQWWRLAASAAHATPIRIKGAKIVTKIDAALDPGAAISGTIRAVNSAGQPLAGICVEATDREGDEFADADSAKNGRYRLDGLAGGRYLIRFDPSCFGQTSSNYLSQQRWVTVRQAQRLTGFNAYLRPGAGLSGVVTNSRGRKVGGGCVSITSGPGSGFAVTDIDGSYSITGLPAGSYTVQFTGGCGNTGSLAPQYYNGEANSGSADPITLAAGTITPGIDATMQPGATITGVVTDPAGHRLSNICVGVADQSQLTFGAFTAIAGSTGKGSYRAENLAPGLYQVDFGCDSSSKYASHWYRASPGASGYSPDLLSVPAGVTSGISAVLRLGGSVAGKVTNTAGNAVSSACLYLVDARTGAQVLSSVFQGNIDKGRYQITGLAAGTYKVFFYACGGNYASQWYRDRLTERAADPVRVRAGHTTAGIGAALAVGGTMSGRVVARATGKPVRNVCVQAYDSASQSFGFAQTGRTGRYLMRGLGTGRYSISFTPCYASGPNLAISTRPGEVQVTAPHAVTGINARLAPGGSVSGLVTGGSHPQIGVCVELVPVARGGSFGSAVTGQDGGYTATGLAAGRYQVYFNDPTCFLGGSQYAAQWYDGQPTQATAGTITVSAGGTTSGIDATLQPLSGITGTVTGPAHAPVGGECVTATPAGRGFAGSLPPEVAVTRPDGSYSLTALQPGGYKVEFTAGCGDTGFQAQWWKDAGSAGAATVITVGAGVTVAGIGAALKH